jgi:hypothetical protein
LSPRLCLVLGTILSVGSLAALVVLLARELHPPGLTPASPYALAGVVFVALAFSGSIGLAAFATYRATRKVQGHFSVQPRVATEHCPMCGRGMDA